MIEPYEDLRDALVMLQRAVDEYFSYSPSRRDDLAFGAIQTARQKASDVIEAALRLKNKPQDETLPAAPVGPEGA